MVAPFFGTLTGGALYDFFIYTGESPINTPYLGFNRFQYLCLLMQLHRQ